MVLKRKIPQTEARSVEQLQEHYQIEKDLAGRLKYATKSERQHLYTALYDELFQRVPQHPQLLRKADPTATDWVVNQRMQLLGNFLNPEVTYLELGPGDCSLALAVSPKVQKVYAVDVSTEITQQQHLPDNFEFVLSDGTTVPVPENTVDVAYSHQLMEHLHPDDALQQLENLYRALKPGGLYICITPNRLSGPHDISRYFDEVATGFHLKEYTVTELHQLFAQTGFSAISLVKSYRDAHVNIPLNRATLPLWDLCEGILETLPYALRQKIANTPLLFRGMTIVAKK